MWGSFQSSSCRMTCWYILTQHQFSCSLCSFSWIPLPSSQVITCKYGPARCSLMLNALGSGWCIKEIILLPSQSMSLRIHQAILNNSNLWIVLKTNRAILPIEMMRPWIHKYPSRIKCGSHIIVIQEDRLSNISTDFIKQRVIMGTWPSLTTYVQGYFTIFLTIQAEPLQQSISTMDFQFFYTLSSHSIRNEE